MHDSVRTFKQKGKSKKYDKPVYQAKQSSGPTNGVMRNGNGVMGKGNGNGTNNVLKNDENVKGNKNDGMQNGKNNEANEDDNIFVESSGMAMRIEDNEVIDKDNFIPTVEHEWKNQVDGFQMFQLAKKLKIPKYHLRKLNWPNRNLFDKVEELWNEFKIIQSMIDKHPHNKALTDNEVTVLKNYMTSMENEEKLLLQKKSSKGKLVNINQSAFVVGRQIQDNILSSQELLKGYDQKGGPKRVAFKIDIQEAYDTYWRSPKFQYHFGCKNMKITHVCFVDDLLVLCHGDIDYVQVIRKSVDEFGDYSGLLPNFNKSTIFFGSVNDEDQEEIMTTVPF
nr:RNA-directed DNA polymerase, eukaryota, reverse transcriptase zinc-binding domain protein [Tanacetum cinerariifolium]